jgi:hypothetical protein
MTLDTTSLNATTQRLLLKVDGVDVSFSCTFQWDYVAMLSLSGSGTGNAQTDGSNSHLSANVDFVLVDYVSQPPTNAVVLSILDLTFKQEDDRGLGGMIVTNIITGLERVLQTTIKGELNGIVCDKMGRLDDALDNMLFVVLSMIDNVFFLGGGGNDV